MKTNALGTSGAFVSPATPSSSSSTSASDASASADASPSSPVDGFTDAALSAGPSASAALAAPSASPDAKVPPLKKGDLLKLFDSKDPTNPQFTPTELKQLGQLARARRTEYARQWSGPRLQEKYDAFVCHPTAKMTAAANDVMGEDMPSVVGSNFDVGSITDPGLAKAIRQFTFLRLAEARGDTYFNGTDATHTDWNGRLIHEFAIPSAKAAEDDIRLGKAALAELDAHIAHTDVSKLPANEQALLPVVRNFLNSVAQGSALSAGFGGRDPLGFTNAVSSYGDQLFGAILGVYDKDSEAFLRDMVSMVLSPDINRVNKGTYEAVNNYRFPLVTPAIAGLYGDDEKAIHRASMIQALVQQYYAGDPRLQQDGYGKGDHAGDMYASWVADSSPLNAPNPDFATLDKFKAKLTAFNDQLVAQQKKSTHDMVSALFPDLAQDRVDSNPDAKKVHDAIDANVGMGAMTKTLLGALPAADAGKLNEVLTGNGPDDLGMIGGATQTVDQAKQLFLDQVWTPLKAFYEQWQKTSFPHAPPPQGFADWGAFWDKFMDPSNFDVNLDSDSTATDSTGITHYDMKTPNTVDEWIKVAIHENTHRMQDLDGVNGQLLGTGVEGQAVDSEEAIGRQAVQWIRGTLQNNPAKAAAGQYATFARDLEVMSRTFAALATMDPTTRAHAESYIRNTLAPQMGMSGADVDMLEMRGFDGTYSLNYPGGYFEQAAKNSEIAQGAGVDPASLSSMETLLLGISPNEPADQGADTLKTAVDGK